MADFGVDVILIPDESLEGIITSFYNKVPEAYRVDLDFQKAGMGSTLSGLLRGFEKGLITSYEPLIAAVRLLTENGENIIDAITNNPTIVPDLIAELTEKVNDIIAALQEVIENPLNFIIEKLLEPIFKEIVVPFPNASGLLKILMGGELLESDLILPPKLQTALNNNEEWVINLMDNKENVYPRMVTMLLLPIQFAIGMLESVITIVQKLLTDIIDPTKIASLMATLAEVVTNPFSLLMEMIMPILEGVFGDLVQSLFGDVGNIDETMNGVMQSLQKIFSFEFLNEENIQEILNENPNFKLMLPFMLIFSAMFSFIFDFSGSGLLSIEILKGIFGIG